MAIGKYTKINGEIRTIIGEYGKVNDAIVTGLINCPKIGGEIKQIPIADRYIHTGERVGDKLYRITDQGIEEWNYAPWDLPNPTAVAVDSAGNTYWACETRVYKLDTDGNLVSGWPFTGHASTVYAIAVDADGYVYTGDFYGYVKKISPVGVEEWSAVVPYSAVPYALALDYNHYGGILYVGTGSAYDAIFRTYLYEPTFYKIYDSIADIISLAVDGDAKMYCGDNVGNYRQMNVEGAIDWTKTRAGGISQLSIGIDGFGYCSVLSEKKILKFPTSTGVTSWEYTPSPVTAADAYGCGVDAGGNVYGLYRNAAAQEGNFVHQIDSSGNYVWKWQPVVNCKMYGLAITPGAEGAGF